MLSTITKIFSHIQALFFPSVCYMCDQFTEHKQLICTSCVHGIIAPIPCIVKITKTRHAHLYAAARYDGQVCTLVRAKHYAGVIAASALAEIMLQKIPFSHLGIDFFVPVPLHWKRFARRGFNQTEEMAQRLQQKLEIPILLCVKRIRYTQYQARLQKKDKLENVKGAFVIDQHYLAKIKGKRLALVDDLYTTGATATVIAGLLYKAGAASVQIIVACKG